jgi:hypothetical protein
MMIEGEGGGSWGVDEAGADRSLSAKAKGLDARFHTEAGHIEGVGDGAAIPANLRTIVARFCECRATVVIWEVLLKNVERCSFWTFIQEY